MHLQIMQQGFLSNIYSILTKNKKPETKHLSPLREERKQNNITYLI